MRDTILRVVHKSRILFIPLLGLVYLAGCLGVKEYSFTPPGDYSQAFLPFDISTVMDIDELLELSTNSSSGPVATARYFPVKNTLLAVYIGDGSLKAWDIGSAQVSYSHDFGITSNVGVSFDGSGDLLMGPIRHEIKEDDFGDLVDYIGGVSIWDTDTGDLIDCVLHPCDEPPPKSMRVPSIGATLDPQGKWAIILWSIGISVSDIDGDEVPYGVSHGDPEQTLHTAQVAFEPNGNRYAVAFREG